MDTGKLISNFSVAIIAQAVSMTSSIVTALLLPKIMGVEEYGYWQLFLFYGTYVGFFQFGLCEGVYLIEGGHLRDKIDRKKVNSQFWFGLGYQLLIAIVIFAIAVGRDLADPRSFVLAATALMLLLANAFTYLGLVLQAMNEPKRYSSANIISAVVFLAPTLFLITAGADNFEFYVGFYLVGRIVSLAYCIWVTRDILSAGLYDLKTSARLAWGSIRVGIKLMLANITGMLILGFAQFVVNLHWSIEVFSIVSYAIAMSNFFLFFISQASMVLFPALRLAEDREVRDFFFKIRDGLNLLLPCVFVLYAPAKELLSLWLPQYRASLELFALLLPLCVFNGKMDLLGTTYLKVTRRETALLLINVGCFALSALGVILSTFVFDSITLVLVSSLIMIVLRSFIAERYVQSHLTTDRPARSIDSLSLAVVALTAVFVLTASLLETFVAWLIIAAAYAGYLIGYRRRFALLRRALSSGKGDSVR